MNAHTPLPNGGMTAEEIAGIIGPLLDEAEEASIASFDERLREAAADAVAATRAWLVLHEAEAAGEHVPFNVSFLARERLQDCHRAHADMQEIVAIGHVGDGLTLYSDRDGLGVYEDGMTDPMLMIPRGVGGSVARLLVQAHRNAYRIGHAAGVAHTQAELRRVMGIRG